MTKASEALAAPLYELAEEYVDLVDQLEQAAEEHAGIVPDKLDAAFDEINGTVAHKLENCAVAILAHQWHADRVKAELDRLRKLREQVEGSQRRLKDYVARQMVRMNIKRQDGERVKIRTQKNPGRVEIVENGSTQVPLEFCDVTVTMPATVWSAIRKEAGSAFNPLPHSIDVSDPVIMRSRIAAYVKATGEQVPGAKIVRDDGIRVW